MFLLFLSVLFILSLLANNHHACLASLPHWTYTRQVRHPFSSFQLNLSETQLGCCSSPKDGLLQSAALHSPPKDSTRPLEKRTLEKPLTEPHAVKPTPAFFGVARPPPKLCPSGICLKLRLLEKAGFGPECKSGMGRIGGKACAAVRGGDGGF